MNIKYFCYLLVFPTLLFYCGQNPTRNENKDSILGKWKVYESEIYNSMDTLTITITDTTTNLILTDGAITEYYYLKYYDDNYYCDSNHKASFYVACNNDPLTMYYGTIYYSTTDRNVVGSTWINPFIADTFFMPSDSLITIDGIEKVYHPSDSTLIFSWQSGSILICKLWKNGTRLYYNSYLWKIYSSDSLKTEVSKFIRY
jgi:hypothetical protein